MSLKKAISVIIIYIFMANVFSAGILTDKAYAAEGNSYIVYNRNNTPVSNQYNIVGSIDEAVQYGDSSVINTNQGFYVIQDGKARSYNVGSRDDIYYSYFGKNDGKYYLLSKDFSGSNYSGKYSIVNVDSSSGSVSAQEIKGLPDGDAGDGIVDNNGTLWFVTMAKGYRLMRVGQDGNAEEYKNDRLVSFGGLYCDSGNNIWMMNIIRKNYDRTYEIEKYHEGNLETVYTSSDSFDGYRLAPNGDIWTYNEYFDTVGHISSTGKLIKEYKLDLPVNVSIKDMKVDDQGNVWVLIDNELMEMVGDSFVSKYKLPEYMDHLSIVSKDKILLSKLDGFILIDRGNIEEVKLGSYLGYDNKIASDNLGNVKILSGEYLGIRGPDDKLKFSMLPDLWKSLSYSIRDDGIKGYNNDLYFINGTGEKVYKIKGDNTMEEYFKLSESGSLSNQFEISDKGELYIPIYRQGYRSIYKVGTDKQGRWFTAQNLKEGCPGIRLGGYLDFEKLLKDKNGDIYAVAKDKDTYNGTPWYSLIKVTNLDSVKEIKAPSSESYKNAFINDEGELECVYGSKLYRLNSGGVLTLDTRFGNVPGIFNTAKGMVKAPSGKLLLWDDQNVYSKSAGQADFQKDEDIARIYAAASDDDGGLYLDAVVESSYGSAIVYFPGTGSSGWHSWNAKADVALNKHWTINFNSPINPASVNNKNIYVKDANGNSIDAAFSTSSDGKSIEVIPSGSYRPGTTYYLYITKDLVSAAGKGLSKDIKMRFVTE